MVTPMPAVSCSAPVEPASQVHWGPLRGHRHHRRGLEAQRYPRWAGQRLPRVRRCCAVPFRTVVTVLSARALVRVRWTPEGARATAKSRTPTSRPGAPSPRRRCHHDARRRTSTFAFSRRSEVTGVRGYEHTS